MDLASDDESTHAMPAEEQVYNADLLLQTNDSHVQSVSCEYAAEEEESESLSPHVEGHYFEAGYFDSPPSKRRQIDHFIRWSELLDKHVLFGAVNRFRFEDIF